MSILSALERTQVLFSFAYFFETQAQYRTMLQEKRAWITDDVAREYGIGLAPLRKTMIQEKLEFDGYSRDTLINSGIIKVNDKLEDEASLYHRWTLPLQNDKGEIVSFAGRSIDDGLITHDRPKWKNLANTAVFQRSECLYLLDRVPQVDHINLVEGYFDAMYSHLNGISNTACILGVQLTAMQARILYRRGIRTMTLALDGDLSGLLGAMKAATTIRTEFGRLAKLRLAWLPDGKDPDELEPDTLRAILDNAKYIDDGLYSADKITPNSFIERVLDNINLDVHENVMKNGGWSTINDFAEVFDPLFAPDVRKRIYQVFGTKINFKTPYHGLARSSFLRDYTRH